MNRIISVEYPEFLAISLKLKAKDFENEIKISSMVKLFELGKISSGTAAKVLGMKRVDFLDLLSAYNVSIWAQYDLNDLKEDLANA